MDVATLVDVCNYVFTVLGPAHSEVVYQKALVIELYNRGASSVETEKHVPVFFVDSNNITHTVGSERVDVLVRFNKNECIGLIELKAQSASIRDAVEVAQLKKYAKSLQHLHIQPTYAVVVNFPQNNANVTSMSSHVVEYKHIEL
jgi:GxxExxY protein